MIDEEKIFFGPWDFFSLVAHAYVCVYVYLDKSGYVRFRLQPRAHSPLVRSKDVGVGHAHDETTTGVMQRRKGQVACKLKLNRIGLDYIKTVGGVSLWKKKDTKWYS